MDRNSPGAVISKIEDIFEAMTDCILGEKKELTIQLKTRSKTKSKIDDSQLAKKKTKSETKIITFPSKSPQEAWKFSRFGCQGNGSLLMKCSYVTPNP
jgi:meiotic recombination protein SPO11